MIKTARTVIVAVLCVLAAVATGGVAMAEQSPIQTGAASAKDPQAACIQRALSAKEASWTCVAGTLITPKTPVDQRLAPQEAAGSSQAEARSQSAAAAADDWCLNSGVCTRKISTYSAETAANAAYGDLRGVIGSFKILVRQSLNGRQENTTVSLRWVSGPTMTNIWVTRDCKEDISGWWDNDCGSWFAIQNKSVSRYATLTTGTIYGNKLNNEAPYYNIIHGDFKSTGYSQTFSIPSLETRRFTCPKGTARCYFP